jgi:DNA-binding transcriptional LysR family regulator
MELRHLRYFVAIAEERSFTRAAERLWVAQPGLSTQIRQLESELGVQLFERHTRGVDLTDAGEVFLERARAALSAADVAAGTGRDLEAGLVGSVRLGLSTDARWHGTPLLLAQFAREHEGVELSVLESDGGTLWRDLRDGRVDALLGPADFASPDLHALDLGSEPWVVLVGAGHRLAGVGPVEPRDLRGEAIVVTGGRRDDAAYSRAGADVLASLDAAADVTAAGPWPAVLAGVAAGHALMLTTGATALPPGVTAKPVRPRRSLAFQLLWRQQPPSPTLTALIRLAAQQARDDGALRARLAVAA